MKDQQPLASAVVLLHTVLVVPLAWIALRVITGLCMAGLYLVIESWLNDIATNRTRGQLLSVYMVVMMTGMGLGQLLLNLADPGGFELFILVSVLISFALIPMLLSAGQTPEFSTPEPVNISALYRASPLGIVGSISTGIAQGSVFGMGAVYASINGMSVVDVSLFMTAFSIGAVVLQWPIGWLSDRIDRRKVIVFITAISAILSLLALLASQHSSRALIITMAIYGGISVPLYALFIAHTNDHLQPTQRIAASAGLVMINGLGAAFGPMLCALVMSQFDADAFLYFLCLNHTAVTVFGLWRMTRRDPVPLDEQPHYAPIAPRGTSLVVGIASRTVLDADDGETARWSKL